MKNQGRFLQKRIGCHAVILLFLGGALVPAAAQIVTNYWIGGSGDFGATENWDTGIVPSTANDVAYFMTNDTVTITFPDPGEDPPWIITNYNAVVRSTHRDHTPPDGNFTWNLMGHEYRLVSTTDTGLGTALAVGNQGPTTLAVTNGHLHTAGFSVGINFRANPSHLILTGSNTTWYSTGTINGTRIGENTVGTLSIRDGASADLNTAVLGHFSGRSGFIELSGAGSVLTNRSTVYVGNFGSGTVSVLDGGHWQAATIDLNRYGAAANTNDLGRLVVDGGTIAATTLRNAAMGSGTNAYLHTTLYSTGTNALISLTGNLTINAGFKFHLALDDDFGDDADVGIGTVYTIIGVGGTRTGLFENPDAGFADLKEGDIITRIIEEPMFGDRTYEFQVSYTGGSGQDFTLTVIPEPGVLALLGLAGLGLVWMRRRRV